ncbi:MAG: 4Fe-4S dicluster domain-containing protein [Candidatus Omnitrophica bacterium]|nr:4Fe-4S dicluster domain-containing protein [Candidatus Omnitrophota bacterium]MDD5552312.1 4Fe-4S dicluster domain-containing protein [Candidatus Omnitrophota bacterium]
MGAIYYSESGQLNSFYNDLKKKFRVFSPVIKEQNYTKKTDYSFQDLPEGETLVYNPYRAVEPLKSFFTYPQEKAAKYFNPDEPSPESKQVVIFGVKSCDIAGHKVQDFIYLEGVEVDEQYRFRRENTIFISSDCTDYKEVCHCLAWDILPHPTWGFDLNLSPLNEGYLVEVGSEKGEGLITRFKEYFVLAKESQIAARKVKRENLINRLSADLLPKRLVKKDTVQKLMRQGYDLDTWQQFMLTCVECGGCNLICDTCHCFLLADKKEKNSVNSKLKLWDSCLYANYARVAGGANPNKRRAQRLRFRFTKKFDFFVDNLGMQACCGCGRCIEVCPGKIDIREVLKDLAKKLNINQ